MVLRGCAAALTLALAGCTQSLFDANVDAVDGGAAGPDAASLCPSPCVGDAVGEYAREQGGTNDLWRYRSDGRDELGVAYADMVFAEVSDGLPGWIAESTPRAGIASCRDTPGAAGCAGLADHLLLVPSAEGAAGRDPVVSFRVPRSGVYRLTGQLRLPDGGTSGIEQQLLVSRNGRHDFLFVDRFRPSLTPGSFDLEVEAAEGDQLLLAMAPAETGVASPLGLRFFVSEGDFPARCQQAGTFDGTDEVTQLLDRCTEAGWSNSGTTSVPSVSAELGSARQLTDGTFLKGTDVIDRSGDFTIQFWFRDVYSDSVRLEPIYADIECSAEGGMWLTHDDDGGANNWDLAYAYHGGSPDWCNDSLERLAWTLPVDDAWHFYRITRSRETEALEVCVDGRSVASKPMPADQDLTGEDPPYLGKYSSFGAAETTGIIDDFRAFKRALPCDAP